MKTEDTFTYALRRLHEEMDRLNPQEKARMGIEILKCITELEEKRGA